MECTIGSQKKYQILFIYLMIRKNSEKRFHTAGARIVNNSKLPPDFFNPNGLKEKRAYHLHRSQPHKDQPTPTHARTASAADLLMVSFHRANTQHKMEPCLRYSCGEGERNDWAEYSAKKSLLLPRVRLTMEKQNNFGHEGRELKLMKIRNRNTKNSGWVAEDRQPLKL